MAEPFPDRTDSEIGALYWWAQFFYRVALEIRLGWLDGDPGETMNKAARMIGAE